MYKKEDIIRDMRTKKSGSIAHRALQKKYIKILKNEHRMRLNNAMEYSISLFKVFKNKLLKFL